MSDVAADIGPRQRAILDLVSAQGYAGIDQLVGRFEVTPQTIRRDLQDMADRGLLRRHHGGASRISTTANADYGARQIENAAEKTQLAVAAARLIAPGSSLFMTPGTTIEAVAHAIVEANVADLKVVTNSVSVARILGGRAQVQVTGGVWQANNQALAGPTAVEAVERYRCDMLVTSIGGIDPDGTLLEYRDEDALVARAMVRSARRHVLVADHTKFARTASCRLAHLSEFEVVITNRPPPASARRILADARADLILAE